MQGVCLAIPLGVRGQGRRRVEASPDAGRAPPAAGIVVNPPHSSASRGRLRSNRSWLLTGSSPGATATRS